MKLTKNGSELCFSEFHSRFLLCPDLFYNFNFVVLSATIRIPAQAIATSNP